MKYMMTFAWSPDTKTRAEGFERFQRTGGQPPEGVKLLGRCTRADLSGGFDLLETEDPRKLAEFSLMWSDLMELRIIPVLDDEELNDVLQKPRKAA